MGGGHINRRVKGKAEGKLTLTVGTSIGPLATVMKKGSRSWVAGLYKGK